MDVLDAVLLILGGIIALSGLIALKRPDLKQNLDALVPFKALIGVGLIICAIVNFAQMAGALFDSFKLNQLYAASIWCTLIGSVLLGVLFGWPIIASMMPDNNPQARAKLQQMADNIAVFQLLVGAAGILAAIVFLLFRLHVIPMQGGFVNDMF